jgi:phosphoserine aminotransferase
MSDRVYNFSAGPAALPQSVLEEAQRDLVSLPDLGVSPLEISHRSPWFEDVIGEAEANLRALLSIADTHHVLFIQGGASLQFSMVAMNLLREQGRAADHVVTGTWSQKAVMEAEREGEVRVVWSGKAEGFVRVPNDEELIDVIEADAAYVHVTSNETIHGVEFPGTPASVAGVPIVCDASSNFLSRPVDLAPYGVLYAGAQKNAGPAGVTVAIVRDDMLDRVPDGLPTMLDYRTYAGSASMHNTPPVFAVYVLMLVTRWLREDVGGLDAQLAVNREKAGSIYDAIDGSDGFYSGHARPGSRSQMNVTFRLPDEELERRFVGAAAERGLVELKGHRSVGGIRASLYNAMPVEGAHALAGFMREFAAAGGSPTRA